MLNEKAYKPRIIYAVKMRLKIEEENMRVSFRGNENVLKLILVNILKASELWTSNG